MRSYTELESFDSWTTEEKDQFTLNVMKCLILDGIRKANSGHSGGPLSSADFAYVLFKEYLNFDPDDDQWFNRDRFVLSAGHESMLQYALLHFVGWMPMDEIQKFRQLYSQTPGHPEVGIKGVECTTGPLGQGVCMGIGMAVAETVLREMFKKQNSDELCNHFSYILCSDGDLQEPVALGAAALAGHWGLSKIVMFYDANEVQISGYTNRSDSTNVPAVFEGLNWHVQEIDGHDHDAIRNAIEKAQVIEQPSIIVGSTIMAHGTATMETDHKTHGAPLPQDEIEATKEKLLLPNQTFYVPDECIAHFQSRYDDLKQTVSDWTSTLTDARSNSQVESLWKMTVGDELPDLNCPEFEEGASLATRKAFGTTLDFFATQLPHLVGGSADLEPSNYTGNFAKTYGDYLKENPEGRNFAFGVREFPMAAMMNGMSLHGGVIPFGGTFLVFADYSRPALRLGAIQHVRTIHEFTHDSFYVGEDGPTHQPIEHAMALRTIPNFYVFRPGDAKETAACFEKALELKTSPSALLLTRQGVPVSHKSMDEIKAGVEKGGYIYHDCEGSPELVFIATGSEVSLAVSVMERMSDKRIRVVSLPCWEIFKEQSQEYRDEIIPSRGCMKISMEAGITLGWERFVGPAGLSIGLDHYGASAPNKDLAEEFGFTPEKVEMKIREHLDKLL
ncbi:MAG TPA: transketolase [Candidatus Marinimicrobia bacterium]|jgi:transketolase|nr:transketolase [Candidatus Neomarinimicrobiota bacterium]MDP6275498.1 transketolase [Candidatus Neomarinimicrobiota bacterium]MDP7217772.1 transketolase [Candidatus Neomarinimicrobiota bacterium]MDP7436499.1 transketolase [Candidatus Neomarinimicrobiota bacterium]HJL74667.1 transketolase [Candidatus Neomarinimicrobiota bacterium]|tara:strand:- start:3047 stop:5068 length:2022 start_codon:yes stop_codon:yes gene_type:complete